MRFSRCSWSWQNLKGWSPQRIAAARRATVREQQRVEAARDQVALFPELQAEIRPAFENEEERADLMDRREVHLTTSTRKEWAAVWRSARAAVQSMHPIRRAGALRLWAVTDQPTGPYNLATFARQFSQPGRSPWTYLRKQRQVHLWNHGGISKPAHFRDIMADFSTLGRVPHPRLRTQNMISIAVLTGRPLREVKAEIDRRRHTTIQLEL